MNAPIRHHATPNEPLLSLFQRMLDEMEQKESVEWDADSGTLDAAIYHDAAIYDKEIARIFKRVPLCLGHEDQLREPGSMIARGWMCALAIFGVGLAAGDDAGLSAALLVIGLFTVYFTVRMITRPIDLDAERRSR